MTLALAVTFAESAVRDLEGLREWYEKQGTPEVGAGVVAEVIEASEQLTEFPESGRVVPEFGMARLRELVRSPFRIVYRADGDCVRVVRVLLPFMRNPPCVGYRGRDPCGAGWCPPSLRPGGFSTRAVLRRPA